MWRINRAVAAAAAAAAAAPSLSDSLGGLETTKGQIESVSQTFVPSIINASLLSSL